MSWGWSSARGRVLAGVWIGVLTFVVTPGLVDEAVGDGLAWEMRLRSLPARVGVYFVLGLCLLGEPYAEVIRQVSAGLGPALAAAGWAAPATTALTKVRVRVGERPLESLFGRLCTALSPGRAPWSHAFGLLVVAWDGTTIDVADSPANAAAFGRPPASRKRPKRRRPGPGTPAGDTPGPAREGANPQIRLVTLMVCGTRALLDAAMGPLRGKGTGEQALAGQLTPSLHPGMLLLADRNFYSYAMLGAVRAAGAHVLWRVKQNNVRLPVIQPLPDGSWLSRVTDPAAARARLEKNGQRRRRGSPLPPDTSALPSVTVRVIAFFITITGDDGTTRTEPYLLITSLLDWRAAPARDLAALYAWRWAIETGYRECKTYLRGAGHILKGKTPELARQELWALLAVYQAIRTLIVRAAARDGLDPDQISFTAALHATRRTLHTPRRALPATLDATETEILTCQVPRREGRVWVRAVKKPSSPYPSRGNHDGPIAHHATYTTTINPAARRTTTTGHQAKQPPPQPANPP
jgi:hypothetical protein